MQRLERSRLTASEDPGIFVTDVHRHADELGYLVEKIFVAISQGDSAARFAKRLRLSKFEHDKEPGIWVR